MRALFGPAGAIIAAAMLLLTAASAMAANVPVISTVSSILPQANQTITITGTGFGILPPYIGDSAFIRIRDLNGRWNAGSSGDNPPDRVTLVVAAWTDTRIVLGGFRGAYGYRGWRLKPGDRVLIEIWNPQTRAGPATHQTSISQAAAIGDASRPRLGRVDGRSRGT